MTARRILIGLVALVVVTAACSGDSPDGRVTLRVMTHDSFVLDEQQLQAFEADTGITVELLSSGDAVQVLNQAILSKSTPLADVIFGIDNNVMSRALDEGILVPYESRFLGVVADEYKLDPTHHLTPIDVGDVCINFDKDFFASEGVPVPAGLGDLTSRAYANLLVVENPATSTPGLAFMLATIATFGETNWLDFWSSLRENGVQVADGWEDAYFGWFTVGSGGAGDKPLVVSYASSPPADVVFADPPIDEPRLGTINSTCFRQIEFAAILAGTKHEAAAGEFIDFLLDVGVQGSLPLTMFVFPVNQQVELPPVFADFAELVDSPLSLDAATIEANRDTWIEQWTNTVLR